MCAFSSRGAMLRRQYNPTDVIRRLFSSKSRRNLSVASILNERTVGRRERFITWLKDIFNKSAEDKSYKADTAIVDRAATATTFNRPEIAAFMRPADSSDKADVVNQKLANFCVAQSTTKFEDENIHAEKRDTKNDGRAIRQSTISQPSCFTAGEPPFDHQIDTGSSWRDLGKMPRSEENGGAIEFAARDDINVTVHYRCYTSPRHCYLLPPQRTKQPPLLGSRVPNRYISVPTRAIVGFAPRNSKPPIKEPNASEKHEKKDKREKKKPVIRIEEDDEFVSVDSRENRAKMVADDNPKGDPNAAFRYEWGVKLAEEQPAAEATGDNDNFAEKGQQYVTKRLWGVNLKQPEPDVQDAAPPTTANLEGGAGEPRNASSISESGDTTANGAKSGKQTAKKPNASSLKGTTAEYLSTPSSQTNDDLVAAQQDSGDANLYLSSEELRKIMRTSPSMLKEIIVVNDEYNVPEGVSPDAEIVAWRNLAMRSVPDVKDDFLSVDNIENLEILSIRPEAPQPKLDVQVVKSAKDNLEDKKIEQSDSEYTSSKSTGIQQNKSSKIGRKLDDFFTSRKLHTLSMQIRHMHRHINNIQRHTLSLSNNFTLVNKTQLKYPEFVSALSTNSEDSLSKKMIDEASNQTESKSQNKEKSIDSNANNALSSDQFLLQPVEPQTFSNSSQEQVDLAKTLDVIADKEIESSINQMRSTDDKKITSLSDSTVSSEFTQDKSDYKDTNETRHYKKPDANYINLHNEATYTDFDAPSTDRNSTKSNAIKSAKEDSKSKVDDDNSPNDVNDVDDDRSKEYIDGDYVRLPGDPYPYSRENLKKWRVPHSRNLVYKSFKRDTSRSSDSPTIARSTPRNANDANAVGEPRDSHAGDAVMETSKSGGGGASAKNRTGRKSGFQVFSRNQRVVSDRLRGDVVDALGLRQWTEVFSRLDEKTSEAAQGGDVSFRTRYE